MPPPPKSKVMTVGDSLSEGYGMVLPGILPASKFEVFNEGVRGSGISSPKMVGCDWHSKLPGLVADRAPNAIILSLGTNDIGRDIVSGGKKLPFGGPEWEKEYSKRAEFILKTSKSVASDVVWVPMPRFADPAFNESAKAVDAVWRRQAAALGVKVPDVEAVQLRQANKAPDGIHYTVSGYKAAAQIAANTAGLLPPLPAVDAVASKLASKRAPVPDGPTPEPRRAI